jgi:CBS domain-containing protein
MALMDNHKIRHVPVTEMGRLAGMVSINDIVKLRLGEVQSEAEAMRTYINGDHAVLDPLNRAIPPN